MRRPRSHILARPPPTLDTAEMEELVYPVMQSTAARNKTCAAHSSCTKSSESEMQGQCERTARAPADEPFEKSPAAPQMRESLHSDGAPWTPSISTLLSQAQEAITTQQSNAAAGAPISQSHRNTAFSPACALCFFHSVRLRKRSRVEALWAVTTVVDADAGLGAA